MRATRIQTIATVKTGYSFRTRIEREAQGTVAVIQMKDLRGDGVVDCGQLVRTEVEGLDKHHCVRRGDIVFRSRGLVNTSAILSEDLGEAVVAAPLLWIRVHEQVVLPEYLNWYLNQREAQAWFSSHAGGSAQLIIRKQVVDELELPLPDMSSQLRIVELDALARRESVLLRELASRKEKQMSAVLMRIVRGEHE